MIKQLINPKGTEFLYEAYQFSQAVKVGNQIWISGQVGMNEKGELGKDISEQTRIAFENLEYVLKEAGATFDDIVEMTTYHTSMEDIEIFQKVRSEFIKEDYPAWTAVGVKALVLPDFLIEIKATVVIQDQ
ncbi:MAG: endoribonuclease L-PSP [Candidatus Magnetoglobus multicellularis str. Araruama]|uniref:Endoribonuclease L-PSP n=1 Tax=Candidatus Magnetoglobus multicellularis str. Araruama TaxID=890399 RepID=A0A1V1NSA2_9BACT|nr:MAG: endoribonuclease L-PSP [Candidatus Magnetoglobus multicellularis str. Araruama]